MKKQYLLNNKRQNENSLFIDVFIALIPCLVWSVNLYSFRPLVIFLTGCVSYICFDVLFSKMARDVFDFGFSELCVATLTVFLLPPTAPFWLPVLACALSAGFYRMFLKTGAFALSAPVLSALVCHLVIPKAMTAFAAHSQKLNAFLPVLDVYEKAPESSLDTVIRGPIPNGSVLSEFFGMRSGMIGEASAFLLILGFIYLVIRGVVNPVAPLFFAATVVIITYIEPTLIAASEDTALMGSAFNLIGSNTLICMLFLSVLPPVCPKTARSRIICGIVGGGVTVLVRYFLSVEISALIGVLCVAFVSYLCDIFFRPMPFGGRVYKL